MQQADASDVSESIPVITSPEAPLQPDLSAENRQHLRMTEQYDSFADLVRASDRVPSSGFDRRTRL
eukprot:7158173-Pyramimonas_sp.AAC.1